MAATSATVRGFGAGNHWRRTVVLGLFVLLAAVLSASPAAWAASLSTAPEYAGDFPDPFLLRIGATTPMYYAFATGDARVHLRVMTSADGTTWPTFDPSGPALTDALPTLPRWAAQTYGQTWAPEVLPWGQKYLLYYTTQVAPGYPYAGKHCIGVATASNPAGPYTDPSTTPFLCRDGGAIDPSPFIDSNGSLYLLWKGEPAFGGSTPTLWSQQMSPSTPPPTSTAPPKLINSRAALLKPTATWQGGIVEGPQLVRQSGALVLLYGGNFYNSPSAGIGYAACTTPLAACTDRSPLGPWLGSDSRVKGPAGPDVFTGSDGTTKLAYHAWWPRPSDGTFPGYGNSVQSLRALWTDNLSFFTGVPSLG